MLSFNTHKKKKSRSVKITGSMTPHWNLPLIIKNSVINSERGETVQRHYSSRADGQLPEWNRLSQRSRASGWPAPAAPLSSPGLWNRHSADSEGNTKSQSNISCITRLLCSVQKLGLESFESHGLVLRLPSFQRMYQRSKTQTRERWRQIYTSNL